MKEKNENKKNKASSLNKTIKKPIFYVIIGATIASVVLLIIFFAYEKTNLSNNNGNSKVQEENNKVTEKKGITNLKKSETKIPDFTVQLTGLYGGSITNTDLENYNIPVYEFDADIFNGWDIVENHYTGVKLLDILKAMEIQKYNGIIFDIPGKISVDYSKDEISDNTYLVFYRDGEEIYEGEQASIISFDYDYRYAAQGVANLYFYDETNYFSSEEDLLEQLENDEGTSENNQGEDNNENAQ